MKGARFADVAAIQERVTAVYLLVFHAYVNEMHGSRSKIPSKKPRQAALSGGI
jgi:hypothetical protein